MTTEEVIKQINSLCRSPESREVLIHIYGNLVKLHNMDEDMAYHHTITAYCAGANDPKY